MYLPPPPKKMTPSKNTLIRVIHVNLYFLGNRNFFPIRFELLNFYSKSDFCFNLTININKMPSFEIPADIFTRLSVFDFPEGSSYTFKTHKFQPVFGKDAPNNISVFEWLP